MTKKQKIAKATGIPLHIPEGKPLKQTPTKKLVPKAAPGTKICSGKFGCGDTFLLADFSKRSAMCKICYNARNRHLKFERAKKKNEFNGQDLIEIVTHNHHLKLCGESSVTARNKICMKLYWDTEDFHTESGIYFIIKKSNVHKFINDHPDKTPEYIGETGVNFLSRLSTYNKEMHRESPRARRLRDGMHDCYFFYCPMPDYIKNDMVHNDRLSQEQTFIKHFQPTLNEQLR